MEKRKILLVGGGGHCRSVLDCLRQSEVYSEIGIVDQGPPFKKSIFEIPIVGTDADLPSLFVEGWTAAAVTVGSIGRPQTRRYLFQRLKEIGFALPPIISSHAVIGRDVSVEAGVFIGKRAVVNAGSHVGLCAIINTGAIVEHDCTIKDFVHISPGAVLCGGVQVKENSHVGAGAVVRQEICIGQDSVIGAGSVVVRNIPDGVEAYGNPCRVVKWL